MVVNGISIKVNQGEIVGLLGPNGAGKTTTFYMAVGLVKPLSGKIMVDGADITELPMYKRARIGIGYLAQEPSIFSLSTTTVFSEYFALPPGERRLNEITPFASYFAAILIPSAL